MKKLLLIVCLLVLNSDSLFAGSGMNAGAFADGFSRGYSMVANSGGGGYRMSDEEIQIQYTQNMITEAQNIYLQKMNLSIMEFERIRIGNLRKEE